MKWYLMNTKSTQGSNVHEVNDEGKMLIVFVKPLLSLTLSGYVTARLMQKLITSVDTFFWAYDKIKILFITVNVCLRSPCNGYWLFTTHYIIWDHFSSGLLWMNSKIDDFILSLVFNTKLIYRLNMSFAHHICFCFNVWSHDNCFIDQNSQLARFLRWHLLIVDYFVK